MMESSQVQFAMAKYTPSVLAASALYFAAKMVRNVNIWTKEV
jgi:hypothetical protein